MSKLHLFAELEIRAPLPHSNLQRDISTYAFYCMEERGLHPQPNTYKLIQVYFVFQGAMWNVQ